jgi:hypothetical protein
MKVVGNKLLAAPIKGYKMTDGNTKERKRGGCLAAYLIVFMILFIVVGLSFLIIALSQTSGGSQILSLIIGLGAFAGFVFLIAIWKWKKWGVLGLFGILILNILFSLIFPTRIVNAILAFIDLLIFVFLIRPVWHQME